ncbi:alkaline phosphatase family protein [Microbacterium telephonicum]|uniref:phospholipase C n=1 Tax=Microbacterium telephonicum TaxID=1714841 RepID=A0A498C939_9MICO|nr:alkaline phosphatase family protein [Microbacterium telephonicum]RLK52262.1 phospholipase C [Microbacterium telephonicum]
MTRHPDNHKSDREWAGEKPSRRDFLRRAGIGAAGLAIGGSAGAAITAAATAHPPEYAPLAPRNVPGFDHVVVVMFENRSFDNVLGHLYAASERTKEQFDGLAQGEYTNIAPDGTLVPAHIYSGPTDSVMQQPHPDPGETYPHVNTQLFGNVAPASNAYIERYGQQHPYNAPSRGQQPDNQGFVQDYVINFRLTKRREPSAEEIAVAMGGFSPEQMPVISTLAREFAVYDRWFAGVPSQTFCNRSFFHASTSHGYVVNHTGDDYYKWVNAPPTPTIFNRLEEAGLTWRVYYDATQLVSLTGMLHASVLEQYWKSNFREMSQFYLDAAAGDLPEYAFIEPRMVFNHNDMHPPWGTVKEGELTLDDGTKLRIANSAESDVRAGDQLVQDVYDAVRTSTNATGSNALNTALVITFDEHGGTFDHVAPPSAVPPDSSGPGEMGFTFDRLGLRVPAIVVSAYTAAGTVVHDEMHHGSVINTLCRLHGLRPLTARDQTANPIFNAVNLTTPRQPYTWPQPKALYAPPNPEKGAQKSGDEKHHARPLTSPARGLLGLLSSRFDPGAKIPENYGEAYDALVLNGDGLFGTFDFDGDEEDSMAYKRRGR